MRATHFCAHPRQCLAVDRYITFRDVDVLNRARLAFSGKGERLDEKRARREPRGSLGPGSLFPRFGNIANNRRWADARQLPRH
jgi:hypothetical protein